eukprot:UN17892
MNVFMIKMVSASHGYIIVINCKVLI